MAIIETINALKGEPLKYYTQSEIKYKVVEEVVTRNIEKGKIITALLDGTNKKTYDNLNGNTLLSNLLYLKDYVPIYRSSALYQIHPNGTKPIRFNEAELGGLVSLGGSGVAMIVHFNPNILMVIHNTTKSMHSINKLNILDSLEEKSVKYDQLGTLPAVEGVQPVLYTAYNNYSPYLRSLIKPIEVNEHDKTQLYNTILPSLKELNIF